MDIQRFCNALLAFGLVGLATTACSEAESRESPETQPVAAVEEPAAADAATSANAELPPAPAETRRPAAPPPATEPAPREPAPAPAEPEATPVRFAPAGTEMTFRLDKSLSTRSSETGDRFHATLIEDVLSADGQILVPLGSVARGVVVDSRESGGSNTPAILALRLEVLDVHGETQPFEATIVAADASADTKDSDVTTAAKVAAGTAAGALLGRVIGGDSKGTLVGAGAGAVAGTVYAVKTRDGHATMDEGSLLTVRLDEPLPVR